MRTRPLIIEGRFLHYVLAALPRQSLTLVLLDASLDVRMARFRERGNTLATTDQVILADQQDSNFVQAIYSEVSPHEATALITTDSLSVLEVADRVRRALDAAPV
ncbi:hypothetical protein PLCT2_02982 [Planctomycetaceae bacterium]|nr:hypothetical protein PLCT2_02982 [Planctomycetaceae bacterium]